MQITITARHCEIPGVLRERANDLLGKVGRIAHRPQRAEAVFDDDHGRKVVELHMQLPRGQHLKSSAEADDFRSALDRSIEKLRHQAEKGAEKASRRVNTA